MKLEVLLQLIHDLQTQLMQLRVVNARLAQELEQAKQPSEELPSAS